MYVQLDGKKTQQIFDTWYLLFPQNEPSPPDPISKFWLRRENGLDFSHVQQHEGKQHSTNFCRNSTRHCDSRLTNRKKNFYHKYAEKWTWARFWTHSRHRSNSCKNSHATAPIASERFCGSLARDSCWWIQFCTTLKFSFRLFSDHDQIFARKLSQKIKSDEKCSQCQLLPSVVR